MMLLMDGEGGMRVAVKTKGKEVRVAVTKTDVKLCRVLYNDGGE